MIPIATTTVTVLRSDQDGTKDQFDGVTRSTLVTGVRAVIGSPSGTNDMQGGDSESVTERFQCDPTDIRHDDLILDEISGLTWNITWVRRRMGFGLDHMVGELQLTTDRAGIG